MKRLIVLLALASCQSAPADKPLEEAVSPRIAVSFGCDNFTYHVATTPDTEKQWCFAYRGCGAATTMTWLPPELCGLPQDAKEHE
mgnify:CR=1 FL=1